MKPDPRTRSLSPTFLAASLAIWAALAQPAGAVGIGLDPGSQSVALGSTAQVDVVFFDLGGEIVSAYDLDVTYDPAVLDATAVLFTTSLGDELFFEVFNDSDLSLAGVVDLAQLSLLPDDDLALLQPGESLVAATLLFDAVGEGTTELDFVFDDFNDVKGRNGGVLPILGEGSSIRVQAPIPEPSAALLFGMGAAAFCAGRRRQPRGAKGDPMSPPRERSRAAAGLF